MAVSVLIKIESRLPEPEGYTSMDRRAYSSERALWYIASCRQTYQKACSFDVEHALIRGWSTVEIHRWNC